MTLSRVDSALSRGTSRLEVSASIIFQRRSITAAPRSRRKKVSAGFAMRPMRWWRDGEDRSDNSVTLEMQVVLTEDEARRSAANITKVSALFLNEGENICPTVKH